MPSDAPTAYPLAWPHGRPRTPAHQRREAAFRSARSTGVQGAITVPDAYERLSGELNRLAVRYSVLSTNLELRRDGRGPLAGQRQPADPGAVVYFQLGGKPIALSCDRWATVAANMAALAAHINAMRGMDRWGVGSVEQMFAGFVALPPPNDWRSALGNPATLADAEAAWRERMRRVHPDAGGTTAEAAALNAAIAEARKVLRDG